MADMLFWNNVNNLIKSQKSTQDILCKQTGISINTLRGWISKGVLPRTDEAVKIATALHTSVEYLVTGKEYEVDSKVVIKKYLTQLLEGLD